MLLLQSLSKPLRNALIVVLIKPKKAFITLTPRVDVMKLSTLSLMLLQNKLVFVPGKAFFWQV
jgi:hypothetical protein